MGKLQSNREGTRLSKAQWQQFWQFDTKEKKYGQTTPPSISRKKQLHWLKEMRDQPGVRGRAYANSSIDGVIMSCKISVIHVVLFHLGISLTR
eukprot:1150580-Pelagomonas_calceolata.AAC.11